MENSVVINKISTTDSDSWVIRTPKKNVGMVQKPPCGLFGMVDGFRFTYWCG